MRNKYRMKNTTGYSLNAFLDFETAVDIFQHVVIGSKLGSQRLHLHRVQVDGRVGGDASANSGLDAERE